MNYIWQTRCALIALLIIGANVRLRAANNESCDSLLSRGDYLYGQFDNAQALTVYDSARKVCKDRYEPLMKYTRALIDMGEDRGEADPITTALTYTDSLQTLFPDSVQGYFLKAAAAGNLAEMRQGSAQVKLARTVEANAKKSIELDSLYAPAYVILGAYYAKVAGANWVLKQIAQRLLGGLPDGSYEDALNTLRTALSLDSANMHAHYRIARVYADLDSVDLMRQHAKRALDLPINDNEGADLKENARELLNKE